MSKNAIKLIVVIFFLFIVPLIIYSFSNRVNIQINNIYVSYIIIGIIAFLFIYLLRIISDIIIEKNNKIKYVQKEENIIYETEEKLIPVDKNLIDKCIFDINDLLKEHFNKIRQKYQNNAIVIGYLNSIYQFITTEISVRTSEKYLLLLNDKRKHTFVLNYGSDDNFTVFYVELYPSSKQDIKKSQFQESYLDALNNSIEILYQKTGMTIQQFRNSTFIHIMFFHSVNIIDLDVGIRSIKYDFGHAPLDLLSNKDKITTGL